MRPLLSRAALALAALTLVAAPFLHAAPGTAEEGRVIPPPAFDPPAGTAERAVAVFAGGCFWGGQGMCQHTKGVLNAVSGYAGGDKDTANYDVVSVGRTKHAEAVEITYDPRQISYGVLLKISLSVVHDPTELNRQGPDVGPHYRSAIFPQDTEQEGVARAYVAQLGAAKIWRQPIVTTFEAGHTFYPAEDYHQDYMTRNPTSLYIVHHDLPKVAALKRLFAGRICDRPVLVADVRAGRSYSMAAPARRLRRPT